MTFFAGHNGKLRLSRRSRANFDTEVRTADINTSLARIGFDGSIENLITGDRVIISTSDARGLEFLPAATWPDGGGVIQDNIEVYCNVNQAGGVRLFNNYLDAVNNNRANELALQTITGAPIVINVFLFDPERRILGDITGYTFNTDREALETTVLSDRFKRMYSAGLISGAGSIDCLFNPENSGEAETSLLMLQLINRADIGSEFTAYLQLVESTVSALNVYYEFDAVITKSGIEVAGDQIIKSVIDFVTTGEIRLIVGAPPADYILKEDNDRIRLQQSLDYLLQELSD